MTVFVGIDEAGYGPLLGPLIVSSSAFSLPQSLLADDLWQILKKSVSQRRKRLLGRLLIADSKKAHSKSSRTDHLERTILACLKSLGSAPATLEQLLTRLCPDCLGRLATYPWYQNIANSNLSADNADIAIASGAFANEMAANDIKLLELQSRCLDVAYYNRMVGNVKNKASVLFTATAQLIKNACDNFKDDQLQIVIDRQGGRTRYRKILGRMFPQTELTILKETAANSSYELRSNGQVMRLHFVVGADDRFLPVSLASMASKYLRELLVGNINRYFTGFCADLKPTAGYWKDGLRFIQDLKENLPDTRFDRNQLVRCR